MQAVDTVAEAPPARFGYPVMLALVEEPCLVVGAGPVAARKILGLLEAGANVTVIAPHIGEKVDELVGDRSVRIIQRGYRSGDVGVYRLVITATDDAAINAQVFAEASTAGVPVNSADDPENCSFILPAVARQGRLTIAISTDGASPAVASMMRRRIEATLDEHFASLLELVAQVRAEAKAAFGTSEVSGWVEALSACDEFVELVAAGKSDAVLARLRASLNLPNVKETELSR